MSLVRRPNWCYRCSVTYVTQQSTSSNENFSFIVMKQTSHNNNSASREKSKWKLT